MDIQNFSDSDGEFWANGPYNRRNDWRTATPAMFDTDAKPVQEALFAAPDAYGTPDLFDADAERYAAIERKVYAKFFGATPAHAEVTDGYAYQIQDT